MEARGITLPVAPPETPRIFHRQAQERELAQLVGKTSADALAALPSSCGDAPRLGPPLPGDIGRPILRAQQQQLAPVDGTAAAGQVPTLPR